MSTGNILSILAYPQYGYHLVCHTGLSLVHCSYLSVGSLHREVTQWQGKEIRNLGRCLLGVLAVPLRQPDSTQVQPFRRALTCVRSLLDFTLMAQYRSHTPETISYMEKYATQFHEIKDIFFEFRISKRTQEKADQLRKEMRRQRAQMREPVPPSSRRRIRDDDREEENHQGMELIYPEYNFNFVKMHLISHFLRSHLHVQQYSHVFYRVWRART